MYNIQTVGGIRATEEVAMVDSHVHLWVKSEEEVNAPQVRNIKVVESCIKNFKNNGGKMVIDCTPFDCGRDVNKLCKISGKTGIDIVGVTGFHLQKYYPPDSRMWKYSQEEAQLFFKNEIEKGFIEVTGSDKKARAALIKIPFTGSLENRYKILADAAINVSLITGVPLLVHTERGTNVEWFADYIESRGVSPQKVVFCHVDKRNDFKLHRDLAGRGFYLEYDTFLRPKYNPRGNVYVLIDKMLSEGYWKKLMIGTDISEDAMWEEINSTIGYGGFFKQLKGYLLKRFQMPEVLGILGENAYQFLTLN